MKLNKKRLFVVFSVATVLAICGGSLYAFRFKKTQQAQAIEASAVQFLAAKNFDSARIEADKLLVLQPSNANAMLLKAKALLQEREPARIQTTDRRGLDAMRSFIQATRLQPDLIEAQRVLVQFFIGSGDFNEAANAAKEILRHAPNDSDARYAMAANAQDKRQVQDAISHVDLLLKNEKPVRPRTVWIGIQVAELAGKETDLKARSTAQIKGLFAAKDTFKAPQDRLALADLCFWAARQESQPAAIKVQLQKAVDELTRIAAEPDFGGATPKTIVQTATRLLPTSEVAVNDLGAVQAEFAPKVNDLIQSVFKKAIDGAILDPSVYVDYATRLRNQGKADEAVKVLERGLDNAKKTSPEARKLFTLCDLWLAKHYLTARQGDKAQPHIEALLSDEMSQAWGQMLAGYRLVEKSDWEAGSRMLGEAVKKLPEHGIVNVLYGLCQLKRGYISEGRRHLEKGIRLGADDPRYKAWLAVALSEAGYNDQAMGIARQVLADKQTESLGQVLVGQLRLRTGQYQAAEEDLVNAIRSADAANKPALQLMLAEVLMSNKQSDKGRQLLHALQQVPAVSARAYAMEYRDLKAHNQHDLAEKLLTEARMKLPDDVTIVTIDISRLVDAKEYKQAVLLLKEMQRRNPKSATPPLLLSDVYDKAGNQVESVNVLKVAAENLKEDTSLRVRLAERLLVQNNFDEANKVLADLKGNPAVNPSTIDGLLAQIAAKQGDQQKAERIITQLYERDPDNPMSQFLMGQGKAGKGDYTGAALMFEQIWNSGNRQSRTVEAWIESLMRIGDMDKAMQVLNNAQQSGQPVGGLRERLLRQLARSEKWVDMERELDQLIKTDPTEENLALAVSLLRYMKKNDRAKQLLEESLVKMPNSSQLLEHKVAMMLEQKRYDEAERILSKGIAANPSYPTFHVLKIFMLLESKRNKDAEVASRAAWKACPGNPAIAALCVQTSLVLDRPDEANAFAVQAAKENPTLPSAKYMLSRVYEAQGRRDRAIDLLRSLLAENPADPTAAHHYLRLKIAEGQTADIKETVDRLLAANPNNPLLLGVLVEYYAFQGEVKLAEATLERLEAIRMPTPLRAYSQAVVAVARKDMAGAEKWLKVAMADPKGHLPSQFLLARIYASQDKLNQSLDEVSRILRQQPTSVTARLMKVDFLMRLGKIEEAELACRAFLVDDTTNEAMRLMLCQLLIKRGTKDKMTEAVDLAEQLVVRGLSNPSDFETCAKLLLQAGRSERVKTVVANLARGKSDLLMAAGRAFLLTGDAKSAKQISEQVLEATPTNATAKLLLADATAHLARDTKSPTGLEQAVVQYREVLRLIPGHVVAANNMAWILGVQLDKPHRAMEELLLAVPAVKSPSADLPPDLIDTVGVLHLKMGHDTEAQSFLELALTRNPDSASTYFHLGELYRRQKRPDRARQCYQQVVKLSPKSEWAVRVNQARLAD